MRRVLPPDMAIAIVPHLIPASTIPNGMVERALSEPLAADRDEVLYLVCSHARVSVGLQQPDGTFPLLIASGRPGGGIAWSGGSWWGRAIFPSHVRPSSIPWAVLDDALDWAERLPPIEFDASEDPDGPSGQNRQELLPWIYDRRLEQLQPTTVFRGEVDGAPIDLRIEYVGSSGQDALRRPAGAHHKVPTILGRMLLYEPHRLVYLLVCDIRVAAYDARAPERQIKALRLRDAVDQYGVERAVLIAAAEDAMIAAAAAPYNKRNTGRRRFPNSAAAARLGGHGIQRVGLAVHGVPPGVQLSGTERAWTAESPAVTFELPPT
jgi:hypothetical protein